MFDIEVQGLVCEYSYIGVRLDDPMFGYPEYTAKIQELKQEFHFLDIEQDHSEENNFDILKCTKIVDTIGFKDLELSAKPSVGDFLHFNEEDYQVSKVTLYSDNSIIVVVTRKIHNILKGTSLEDAVKDVKAKVEAHRKKMNENHPKKKKGNILDMFSGKD